MIDDDLDADFRAVLARAVAEQMTDVVDDPVVAIRGRVDDRDRQRRRRSRVGVVAAAAAVVVVLGTSIVFMARREGVDDRRLDTTDVAATTPPTGPEVPTDFNPPPLTGPVVTDPSGIQPIPPPPLEVRGDAAVVWTGEEVVLWGGDVEASNMGLPGPSRSFADGAAYSPATGTWRLLSESPLVGSDGTTGAALDDGSVVFVSGGTRAARWFPDGNSWQALPDAPRTIWGLESVGGAVVSPRAGVRFDVQTGQWRTLPPAPADMTRSTFAWTGNELIGVGGSGTPFTSAVAVAYDPAADSWRRLPDPPSDLHSEALGSSWDGSRLVVANYDMRALTFDPVSERWTDLPALPLRDGEWGPTIVSPSGPSTVVLGGSGMVVLADDGSWIPLPHPQPRGQVVDGGETIFLWGLDSQTDTNSLTAVDVGRMVADTRRLQVGVGSVEMPESYELTTATYATTGIINTVEVRFDSPLVGPSADGAAACVVTSQYLGGAPLVPDPIDEVIDNDGAPMTWVRNPESTMWQTAGTTSDTFTITCIAPAAAEEVARSASFRW